LAHLTLFSRDRAKTLISKRFGACPFGRNPPFLTKPRRHYLLAASDIRAVGAAHGPFAFHANDEMR
jgi:hypothetical protein